MEAEDKPIKVEIMETNHLEKITNEDPTWKSWSYYIFEYLSLSGVAHFQEKEALNKVIQQGDDDIYVLYVDESLSKKDLKLSKKTFEYFAMMVQNKKANTQFVIMDVQSYTENRLEYVKIFHYKQKQILCRDVLIEDPLNFSSANCTDEEPVKDAEALSESVLSETAIGSEVDVDEFQSADENVQAEEFDYEADETFTEEFLNEEEINGEKKSMNVLILGQSGVGKSTWVNSIFNYLKYDTLEEAEKGGVICIIPASFTISYMTDEKIENQKIEIGDADDVNEVTESGQSATQDPKTYSFNFGNRNVKIIDTPGLGDTRGLQYDKENMKKILDHISCFDEIHGIIIFMRANETRIGAIFKFCILELLTNLHKSAAKNIIFCFTNSRSSLYTPGDTTIVLDSLLKDINLNDTIRLSKKTMFCMDNEAFRYLCTLKYQNIQRTPGERKLYDGSWEKSVGETKRLFQQISELEPHEVSDTTTLCKARNRILFLTKPLADIQMTIQMNLSAIADEERRIKNSKLSMDELAKKLYIPHIELQPEALDYPRTVCTSSKCVKYYNLKKSNVTLIEYTQICHERCSRKNVITNTYPQSELRNCFAMRRGATNDCKRCGCNWDVHMHITYKQKRVETYVLNSEVVNEMNYKRTAKEKIEAHKKDLEMKTKQFEEEQKIIIQISSQFGVFLKENAITPYNDGFKDYLQYLIEQEKNKVNKTQVDDDLLKSLYKMMRRYEEEVKILQESMKHSNAGQNLTPEDVHNLEKKLYKLKLTGKQIKKNVQMSMDCGKKAQKGLETHVPIDKEEPKSNILKNIFSNFKNTVTKMLYFGRSH